MSTLDRHCFGKNTILALTSADTEYTITFDSRCKGFEIYNRNGHETRYSWTNDADVASGVALTGIFKTIPGGSTYSKPNVFLDDGHNVIYLASSSAADIIEIEQWT